MADFEYKDYSSGGWENNYSQEELSKDEKKLSKEEQKKAHALKKEAKAKAQSERREKRLAELLAMEEAEKKNNPQNKTKQATEKKLVPEDKKKEQTPEDQKLENVEGETTDTKNTPSSSNSEQPQQEIIPKAEVKAKKEGEKEKGKEAEDSEKKKQEEKPEDSKDKLEATAQEGLEQAGQRLTDLVDPSKDGGIERVENTLTETKDQASTELFQNSEEKLQGKKNSILFLKNNEQHKESASVKRKKSEQAVNEKPTEKQAEVQNKKVKEVATTKEPLLEKDASQTLLRQKMEKAMPTTMEQVDEFKENKDLGEVNEMVKGKITQETVKVQQTYQTIENPEKADNPKAGTPLPQKVEPALPTNELGLGKDLLTPIADETLDTSQFTEEAQNLLDKEGITKEQLAEVKSGDLLEAKKELDIIDNTAKAEPSKIKKAEKQEHASINRELKSKEQTEKDKMRKEREAGLRNAQSTQKGTKESLEKKKEEVSKTINGIYERVNKSVLDRLARLEKDIIRKFDAVQAKAMQDFEKNVNKKIEAYKKERYGDSWFSWKKIKDWWTGIDKHPRVIQIFEEETKIFIGTIDRAINDLMAESKRVIDGCKQEVAKAKEEIAEYVKSLPLALQATGKEAQEKINKQLEELDKKIDKVAKELEATLQEKRKKAIEALNEKIEKMKENLGSALSKAGRFLLDAAFKFFKAVLEGMGYSMDDIMPYINKGKKILTSIVTEPGNFFSNLGKGVGGGISNFTTNIGTHLQTGIFDWLTGSMGGTGIQLPIAWDLGGVIFFVSQLLGVGWEQIKMKLGAQVGQENMAHLETAIAQGEEGMETVKKVQKEGVSGAMEVVQDQATEIKETAVSEIKTWAITAIIQAAIPKILSMFNPAGAIVQAILAIYKAVTWFVMNFERIIQWAKAVFDSIAHIASGAIGEATKKVEETMGRSLGLVITFLASQIGLGKVGDAIKKVIQKVRQPIEKVVDKVVKWIADKARKLFKKVIKLWDKDGKDKKRRKHEKEDHGKDEVKQEDKKKHEAIYKNIKNTLEKPVGKEIDTFEKFYKTKNLEAKELETKHQKNLTKGINIDINIESIAKAKKNNNIDFFVRIAPNTLQEKLSITYSDLNSSVIRPLIYLALQEIAKDLPESFTDKLKSDKNSKIDTNDLSSTDGIKEAVSKEKENKNEKIQKEKEELANKEAGLIRKEILEAQIDYKNACDAELYDNNTFMVNKQKLFVATQNNLYIIPDKEAKTNYDYHLSRVNNTKPHTEQVLISLINSIQSKIDNKEREINALNANPLVQNKQDKINSKEREKLELTSQKSTFEQVKTLKPESRLNYLRDKVFLDAEKIFLSKDQKIIWGKKITIGVDTAITGKYAYHLGSMSKTEMRKKYLNFPKSIKSTSVENITFLAAVLAEPSRYEISFISNLLLMDKKNVIPETTSKNKGEEDLKTKKESNSLKDSKYFIYNHTSMTQDQSDQKNDTPHELYKSKQNIEVIERDVNSVIANPKLFKSITSYFEKQIPAENRGDKSNLDNAQLINGIAKIIKNYLKK